MPDSAPKLGEKHMVSVNRGAVWRIANWVWHLDFDGARDAVGASTIDLIFMRVGHCCKSFEHRIPRRLGQAIHIARCQILSRDGRQNCFRMVSHVLQKSWQLLV
jgi:hypothetical protein